jgi:hypothetical protein
MLLRQPTLWHASDLNVGPARGAVACLRSLPAAGILQRHHPTRTHGLCLSLTYLCWCICVPLQVSSAITWLGQRQCRANNGTCGNSWCFLGEVQTASASFEEACREYADKVRTHIQATPDQLF